MIRIDRETEESRGIDVLRQLKEKTITSFRRTGLQKKEILFAMLIFGVTFLISAFAFGIAQYYFRYSAAVSHVESVKNEKLDMLESYFDGINNLTYNIAYSNWMQDICQNGVYTQRRQELQDNAHNFLGSLSTLYEENQFAVIALNGTRVTSTDSYRLDYNVDITEKEWYETLLRSGKYMEAEEGDGKGIYRKHPEWNMTLYYVIHDYNTLDMTGFFVITIPEKNLRELLNSEYEGMYFALECPDGRMITPGLPDNADIGNLSEEAAKVGRSYFAAENTLATDFFEWKLVTVFDKNAQNLDNPLFPGVFAAVLLLTGILLTVGAIAVSKYLTTPILKCARAMVKIKNNHLGILLPNPYNDELGELIGGYNDMSSSLFDLIEKNKTMTELQKEAEIKILESQINPHFLFNTLEIINGLILNRQEQEAMKVCETLGQLYRYNLRQDKWITLQEELEYTRQYLLIVKYKLNDLEVYFDVDEELSGITFMKMILQPLVENSIRHGFRYKTSECCISISASRRGERVHMEVMDNGSGMEESQLKELNQELEKIYQNPMEKLPESTHIGLRNVVQRLYLEYGDGLSVIIVTNAGYGMRIELEMPIEAVWKARD